MTRTTRVLSPAVALAAAGLVLCGCSASPSGTRPAPTASSTAASTESGIGAWPSFLPSPSSGGVARGSTASPALSYPGSPVVVTVDGGDVRVDVVGPAYPADTKVGADQVPCTFEVTFSAATGTVALAGARFDVLDHTGAVHALAAGPLPQTLGPGRSAHVRLTATLPSGEGLLRLYPSGPSLAAGWDYVAETD